MNLQEAIKPGVRIIASNNNEELHGTVVWFDIDSSKMKIDNVFDKRNNYKYDSYVLIHTLDYNLNIIDTISKDKINKSLILEDKIKEQFLKDKGAEKKNVSSLENGEFKKLSGKEWDILERLLNATKIIHPETDKTFFGAIGFLEDEKEICLVLLSENAKQKSSRISYMAVASWGDIFIFDFTKLKSFPLELKKVLENPDTRKIIYSKDILKYLENNYNMTLKNVLFFTELMKPKSFLEVDPLQDALVNLRNSILHYLKLPSHFVLGEASFLWKDALPELSVLQLKLFDLELHRNRLKNFYSRCYEFSKTLSSLNQFESLKLLQKSKFVGAESINVSDEQWKPNI